MDEALLSNGPLAHPAGASSVAEYLATSTLRGDSDGRRYLSGLDPSVADQRQRPVPDHEESHPL
jgi:hypothetical protein